MARPIWKGSIAFGLVHIPVELHSAHESHELSFSQLDKRDFSPIGYRRYNKVTGKEVDWKDVVRGVEQDEESYVVLTDAEMKQMNPTATQTIDIVAFVDKDDIDPFYYEQPYYLSPGKNGQKPYALLREALVKTNKVGVAQVVLRTKQHLAALIPRGEALAVIMLRYAHEIRDADDLSVPSGSLSKLGITAKEMTMAERLVSEMGEKWKPAQYKDTYTDELRALIAKKAKAGEVNSISKVKAPKAASVEHVTDLMDLLKKSLGGKSGKPANDHRAGSVSKAHSKKPAKKSESKTTKKVESKSGAHPKYRKSA